MNIDFEKLRNMGFEVSLSKNRQNVEIFPVRVDGEITEIMRDLCGRLGFNESESDQFFTLAHKVQVMSAIRKCSNW